MQDNRNFRNRTLFWGDNIDFLRAMNSETVDLIATDPPFNKGRDFHATPDSLAAGAKFQDRWKWDEEAHPQFVNALEDDPRYQGVWTVIQSARASWGDDMGAFMCFMGVRLLEMRRLLKPTGSIYLHCDPTASHYLKTLMDAIFGRQNFRNEIVWAYTTPANTKRWFPRKHDTILFYAKSEDAGFNRDDVRVPYKRGSKLDGKGWETGQVYTQEDVDKGKVVMDWWADITPVQRLIKEMVGYPTQKPLALYERIIKASSNEGDLVLDPFAGCATTCVAAERLNRQWVGIDLWNETKDTMVRRLESEKRMFAVEQMTVTPTPPERTDDGEVASPDLSLKLQRQPERWQRLFRRDIFDRLREAQESLDGVECAGCGRALEMEFMELDHIQPRSERGTNYIDNRILLCRPCNGRKADKYTLRGLRDENKKVGWMRDVSKAEAAEVRAHRKAEEVKDELT